MNIANIIQILENKVMVLSNAKSQAVSVGDLEQVVNIENNLTETQNSIKQLSIILDMQKAVQATNATSEEVIASGIQAIQETTIESVPTIQGPSAEAIVNGYDISAYATDPNHEQKIKNIVDSMPTVNISSEIDTYIKGLAPNSPLSGEMILNAANQYTIDIRMLLAIMQNDSQFGTLGVAVNTQNPGNVGNNGINTKTFSSWAEGVNAVAEWLSKHRVSTTI